MFQGNANLRRAGEKLDYTQDTINELIKCSRDIIYFAEKYFYIIHPDRGKEKITLYDWQKKVLKAYVENPGGKKHCVVKIARQSGKALSLDTPILTPSGFVKLGELNVGDKIYGRDGNETKITFITETMNNHDVYEVEFDNGEVIKADAEHLWTISNAEINRRKFKSKEVTLTTLEMKEMFDRFQKSKKPRSVYINSTKPLNFKESNVPIDPYLLGLWIGDGNRSQGRITCHIDDYNFYSKELKRRGIDISEFRPDKRRKSTGYFSIKGLERLLKDNNLFKNKHIPDNYIFNSFDIRLDFLKGLMDSDGYICKRGSCCFYQSDIEIVKKFRLLISTLGIKSTLNEKETEYKKCYYTRFISENFKVFNLKRKLERQSLIKFHSKNRRIYISDIRKVESEPVRCLQVDNKEHLFLCGETLIPTHNTTISTIFLLWYALFNKDKTVAIVAHKQDAAIDILKRIKMAIGMLPLWLQQGLTDDGWNKKSVVFENGSRIIASATSAEALTSLMVNLLFLDEFAKVPAHVAEEFITSTYPVISSGKTCKIIMISCVIKDTFVFTENGIRTVENFIIEDKKGAYDVNEYKVVGMDGLRSGFTMFNSDKVNTNILKTTFGELECSENHKLWACKNGNYGWYKSSDLDVGDFISIKYGMNIWGNDNFVGFNSEKSNKFKNLFECEQIDEKIAYFLGLFIAEGYVYKTFNKNNKFIGGNVTITCGDDVSYILDNLGFKYYFDGKFHYNISCKDLILFLEYIGFDLSLKAKNKIIPNKLLSMDRNNIIAMLSGIFDGDGYSRKDKGIVGISMNSKKLIMQIKMILLNLGIITDYLEIDTKPTKKVKKITRNYRLLMDKENSLKFYKLIGFNFKRKQDNLKFLNFIGTRNSHDIIPFSREIIKENYSNEIRKLNLFRGGLGKKIFSRKYLLNRKEEILNTENNKLKEFVNNNVKSDLKWFKINSIEKSENEVFDFSLNNIKDDKWCHSVLYNGVVGHQTPKGLNHFYEFWAKAIRKERSNNFFPIRVGWWEVPGRDDDWKEEMIADIGPIRFAQEFQCVCLETIINIRDITTEGEKKLEIGEMFKDKKYK